MRGEATHKDRVSVAAMVQLLIPVSAQSELTPNPSNAECKQLNVQPIEQAFMQRRIASSELVAGP